MNRRRAFGQHYLVDPSVIQRMIEVAELLPTDSVVEIGTGKGALTQRLAFLCARLDGYEIDRKNYQATLAAVHEMGVHLHLADGFQHRSPFDVLVSSLPYSRSLDFVEWISQVEYKRGVVLLQEDFVRKVLSEPGERDYRAVSAIAQISSEMVGIEKVGRNAFAPAPRVSSTIVSIVPRRRLAPLEISNIKRLFSLRRRKVASVLRKSWSRGGTEDYGVRRVSSLSPDEVYYLCRLIPGET